MNNVLFIANRPDVVYDLASCVDNVMYNKYILSDNRSITVNFSNLIRKFIPTYNDGLNDENIIKKIKIYCTNYNIDLLIQGDMYYTCFLSKYKDRFESVKLFPLPRYETFNMLNNKWDFYNFLKENKLPVPETQLITKDEDVDNIKISFPVIVKPVDSHSRKGVVCFNSLDKLKEYLSKPGLYNKFPLLVQEFISGTDIDLNVLAKEGELVAFSVQKWDLDGRISFVDNEQVCSLGKEIVRLTKYNGVAHFDMRIDKRDNTVKVIECNPRFWNSIMASKYNNVNFVDLGIRLALGKTIPDKIRGKNITYYMPSKFFKNVLRFNFKVFFQASKETYINLFSRVLDPLSAVAAVFQFINDRLIKKYKYIS